MSGSGAGGTATVWLLAAVATPFALAAMFLVAVTGHRDPADPNCLPDMPRDGAPMGSGRVVMPMEPGVFQLSSGFGPREGRFHSGQDLAAPAGTPIVAATDATVVAAGPASGFGNWIVLDTMIDGQKLSTVYGHMYDDGVLVRIGERVRAGQRIANVGSNGESTGPHLHFEVWPGGRLSGGHAIDPAPWLQTRTRASGHTATAASSTERNRRAGSPQLAAATADGGVEMAALPADKGSEAHWQVDTIRLVRAITTRFPQITAIGGWRPADAYPDHPSGRAADIMIPGWDTPDGKKLGDEVADYVMDNRTAFAVVYVIWRQQYRPADGTPNTMEDRGSPTQNHFDHVHVTTQGHGYPKPGQTYGPVPGGPGTVESPRSGCDDASAGPGGSLKAGSVPAPFQPWILKAARTCAEVSAPLLAAQLENESGFEVTAHNAASGADGPTQFVPATWAAKAVDGDGDGTRSTRSIPDAVMTQAAYDCELAGIAKDAVAHGRLHGEIEPLMLSMYNCGPGATLAEGGVCQNPETRSYVRTIPERAATVFTAPNEVNT
ncbi:M23 family metallopeptidase [Aldersonia kunmingensis]|uniref:M23 family metallopeptidase n=1 Tax=Aldersonia kunmingensis TaxID=408066 RepID=UPI001FE217EF|nr:M23 family metallopeptidase [Aldersonia kunmingensis]